MTGSNKIQIALGTLSDRDEIYRMRHDVYASELHQHGENSQGRLSDRLDDLNEYIVARLGGELAGFVSITPPGAGLYSVDKYIAPQELPFPRDDRLFEVRLLTVAKRFRGTPIAGLLMYAALRQVLARGGERIVAIGRHELLDLYRAVGLRMVGRTIQSGAVRFELMTASARELLDGALARYASAMRRVAPKIDWQLDFPFDAPTHCVHGGAFWEAIGDEFNSLDRFERVISADVLDAWFPPAPGVLATLEEFLPLLVRTSPPTGCEGMVRAIARARGVESACILPGDGSSSLIFQILPHWLTPDSRVLILDPTYGEYAHILEKVIGCQVDRLPLSLETGYQLDLSALRKACHRGFDLVVLVNPNSPTGRHVPREQLESEIGRLPASTRVWVDETYVEYAGGSESLEQFAARSPNVVVCKSMSKVYALSGLRAAYLCAAPALIQELQSLTPPWAVSLPAQVAVVRALQDPDYYRRFYEKTRELRDELAADLRPHLEVVPSVANFLLCHLPATGLDAETVCEMCRKRDLYLRNASATNPRLGTHSVRIAVKDRQTNQRMVAIIREVLGQFPSP